MMFNDRRNARRAQGFFYAAALQLAVKFIRVNTPSQSPSEPEAAQWTLDLQMWVGAFLFE